MQANLEYLGSISYTEDEINFAKMIQKETGKPEIGMDMKINPLEETQEHPMGASTDAGDVSFVVPTIRLGVTTAPKGTPWHSWAVVACSGMSIGHKGMIYATKALAMTMLDLYKNPKMIEGIRKEFVERKGDKVYVPQIPPGPPSLIE